MALKKKTQSRPSKLFVSTMARQVEKETENGWTTIGNRAVLSLFKRAAKEVPAYRTFLKSQKFDANKVRTIEDFKKIPTTSKASYLRAYPLADLSWKGNLAQPAVFSSTSGSTGKPFYFQRTSNLEEQYSVLAELFLKNGAQKPDAKHPTLVIIGFGMGVWIGGTLTYRAFDIASRRGYPVSILPCGVNKVEILKALRDLAPSFYQTILIGYPPFVKDIIDEAEFEKIDISKLRLRFMFAAEAFNEQFRDYLATRAHIENIATDTLNIYGSADIGAMAFETPTSIFIRRLALKNPRVYQKIFGNAHKLPTLAQFNPAYTLFESVDGEILITGDSAFPLIRYAIGDHGGVSSFSEIKKLFKAEGIDLEKEMKVAHVPLYKLPFVYVFERSDFATTVYGLQIYPEYFKEILVDESLQKYITGKFQMATKYDADANQFLEIQIEQKRGIETIPETFHRDITTAIHETLSKKSSEYQELSAFMKERPLFKISFRPMGDPEYFPPGIKQKWVKK